MKLSWLTDIHLNFLKNGARINFYKNIVARNSDALLISGDIAEAPSLSTFLREMVSYIKKPIYFVLGNHDYYRSEIVTVKNEMTQLTNDEPLLYWLPSSGPQGLDNNAILVGQDGWADGRLGDYYNSTVSLHDSRMIPDLFQQVIVGRKQLLEKMQQLADADAQQLEIHLQQAIAKNPQKIIVLTHVPPFKEAALHKGKPSEEGHLPFFSSKAIGDVLMAIATENPNINFFSVMRSHT